MRVALTSCLASDCGTPQTNRLTLSDPWNSISGRVTYHALWVERVKKATLEPQTRDEEYMAEDKTPMKVLQELLQDNSVRQKVQSASDDQQVINVLVSAGATKGHKLDKEFLKQAFDDVKLARHPDRLSEEELSKLASTYMMPSTPPKLCHTESCGGHGDRCC